MPPRYHTRDRNDGPCDRPLDDIILQDAKTRSPSSLPMSLSYKVRNINRSVGTQVSGEIAYQHGEAGLPEGTLELKLTRQRGAKPGRIPAPGLRIVLTARRTITSARA